jgi:hypothetical protein
MGIQIHKTQDTQSMQPWKTPRHIIKFSKVSKTKREFSKRQVKRDLSHTREYW